MRASRAWLACLLLLPTLACRAGGTSPDDFPAPDRQKRSAAPTGRDESLREDALALLDERARALTDGDHEAFLGTVDPDEIGFSATRARWFDNLVRLPVADVSFEIGDEEARGSPSTSRCGCAASTTVPSPTRWCGRSCTVAFPVLARPGGPVAAYRIAVNPTVVGDVLSRGLVFRHELAHVALGATDDRSPVWLKEGAAEYVARSTMPVDERRRFAAYQLGATTARTLEPSKRFHTGDPTLSYNLAALVCDYVATTRGEAALWDLVRTFRTARFFSWAQTEDVVRRELGLSTEELTAQALAWARDA